MKMRVFGTMWLAGAAVASTRVIQSCPCCPGSEGPAVEGWIHREAVLEIDPAVREHFSHHAMELKEAHMPASIPPLRTTALPEPDAVRAIEEEAPPPNPSTDELMSWSRGGEEPVFDQTTKRPRKRR